MISLKRIIEQQDTSGQYYDLGKDFSNFKRMIDGSFEQVKQRFEQNIGEKLVGKRVKARASRGYKQYVKDYEFDVTKISIDDYYDNYVVVAYDNSTPKPKEYFLKPGFKVTIVGPATGQPSPQKGGDAGNKSITPRASTDSSSVNQPMAQPSMETPVKEDAETKPDFYDAYSIDMIGNDVPWLKQLLIKPETAIRDFIPNIGWMTKDRHGNTVSLFDLKIPINALKTKISPTIIKYVLKNRNVPGTVYRLNDMKFDKTTEEWNVRIKKTVESPTI